MRRIGSGPTVAVVGGGITGLVAARAVHELLDHGRGSGQAGGGASVRAGTPGGGSASAGRGGRVEVFEAGVRLGGQIHTVEAAGTRLDVGAEAIPGIPPVRALLVELGLSESAVTARAGTTWLWTARGLRPLPAGVGLAGPSRLGPVLRSRILSPRGLVRAALEPLLPRTDVSVDQSVASLITARFGREVTERLVEPLLGTLHAGDVTRLSVRATAPALAELVSSHRSVLLAHRARRAAGAGPPPMLSWPGGLAALVDRLRGDLEASGVGVHLSSLVVAIEPASPGYRVVTATGATTRADAVVLAVPADRAAELLAPLVPEAVEHLRTVRCASVATVLASYPRCAAEAAKPLAGNGLLVPPGPGRVLKSATFLSSKWAHLHDPDRVWVRLSVGRAGDPVVDELDDDALIAAAHADLAKITGLAAEPLVTRVQRWPHALPQLEVGHLDRMAAARLVLARWPGLVLAGAGIDGPGVAAGIASGQRAAAAASRQRVVTG